MTRRTALTALTALVALVAALAASACSTSAPDASPTTPPATIVADEPTSSTSSPTPSAPSATPSVPLPPPEPATWEPSANEVVTGAKREAATVVHQLVNDADQPLADRVARITSDVAERERLVDAAEVLQHPDAWSRGSVVYPQMGGLRGDRASVMVIVEQRFPRGGAVQTVTRTLDVRLVRQDDGTWEFDQLASLGGQAPGPGDQTPAERALLADDRVMLPDSARWDVESGDVSPVLVMLMERVAERTRYDVTTLSSGHPVHVFGTDRTSKHTRGQAVDIHLLEGQRIIDLRDDGSAAHDLVRWLYDQPEVAEVGSPWALDGYGGRSFTDRVHHDHIHVGIVPRDPQPTPSETTTPAR